MHKTRNKTRISTTLAICALLAGSVALADEQVIAQTVESAKADKAMPSEASDPAISDQAEQTGSQQSESANKPTIPDHLPSVFVKAVPLSSSIGISADFTPGIAGVIMNIANAANSVRQATSDKFKVFYIEDGHTLFQGRMCLYRSVEIDNAETVSKMAAGDLFHVTRDSGLWPRRWSIDLVKEGEPQKVDTSHLCYESFQKQAAN